MKNDFVFKIIVVAIIVLGILLIVDAVSPSFGFIWRATNNVIEDSIEGVEVTNSEPTYTNEQLLIKKLIHE